MYNYRMIRIVFLCSAAVALSTSGNNNIRIRLKVYDDVLPNTEQRTELHQYAKKLGLEHKCFTRYTSTTTNTDNDNTDAHNNRNIIEKTLDLILNEIDNNNGSSNSDGQKQYIEYWTRQEWRHIEAHADVDENLSRHMDKQDDDTNILKDIDLQSKYASTYQQSYGHRYPIFGHVLYLQVGTDVRGPTVVFPNRSSGGDLLKDVKDLPISEEEECSEEDVDGVSMSIIPAVEGRLLRFDGRDLHTVPRPTDIWMLPFVRGGAEYEPEEQFGRSVILFNVWPGDEDPPLDVPLDIDIEHDEQQVTTTTELCNSFSNWKEVTNDIPTTTNGSDDATTTESNQSVKIWLLGNERRRDHPLRTVPLLSPKDGGRNIVRKALSEESKVTELLLRRK